MANSTRMERMLQGREPDRQEGLKRSQDRKVRDRRTSRGTLIPPLGDVYRNADVPENEIARRSVMLRRQAAMRAAKESVKTEEFLREYNVEIPPEGVEDEAWYMKAVHPLMAVLTQLQRGQFAVVGGLEGIIEGNPGTAIENFYRGLIEAEEHSVGDILDRFDLLQDNPALKFTATLAGDIALDPLTWLSLGASGAAKAGLLGASRGAKWAKNAGIIQRNMQKVIPKADDVVEYLSPFGKKLLKEATDKSGEHVAVAMLIKEVAEGTKVGNKVVHHGVRLAHWVPRIGGRGTSGRISSMFGRNLAPGGILQRVDDINASQNIFDKLTAAMVASKPIEWFGEAFKPYWYLRGKYPWLAKIDQALRDGEISQVNKLIERGKAIAKDLDPKERAMLTEYLQNPERLTGGKFITVTEREGNKVVAIVNQAYFNPINKIKADDAEDFLDFFMDVKNRVAGEAAAHGASPNMGALGLVSIKEQGGSSAVYGKFTPLEPIIRGLLGGLSDKKTLDIGFGTFTVSLNPAKLDDLMIKIPGQDAQSIVQQLADTKTPMFVLKRLKRDIQTRVFGAVDGIASEMYVWRKAGGTGHLPDHYVAWRSVEDLYGTGFKAGGERSRSIAMRKATDRQSIIFDAIPEELARQGSNQQWAVANGLKELAERYKNLGDEVLGMAPHEKLGVSEELFEKILKEVDPKRVVDLALSEGVSFGKLPVPVLIKKHISGIRQDEFLRRLSTDSGGLLSILRKFSSAKKKAKKLAGKTLARDIRKRPRTWRSNKAYYGKERAESYVDAYTGKIRTELEDVAATLAIVAKSTDAAVRDVAKTGMAIRDLHPGNIVYSADGSVANLIDTGAFKDFTIGEDISSSITAMTDLNEPLTLGLRQAETYSDISSARRAHALASADNAQSNVLDEVFKTAEEMKQTILGRGDLTPTEARMLSNDFERSFILNLKDEGVITEYAKKSGKRGLWRKPKRGDSRVGYHLAVAKARKIKSGDPLYKDVQKQLADIEKYDTELAHWTKSLAKKEEVLGDARDRIVKVRHYDVKGERIPIVRNPNTGKLNKVTYHKDNKITLEEIDPDDIYKKVEKESSILGEVSRGTTTIVHDDKMLTAIGRDMRHHREVWFIQLGNKTYQLTEETVNKIMHSPVRKELLKKNLPEETQKLIQEVGDTKRHVKRLQEDKRLIVDQLADTTKVDDDFVKTIGGYEVRLASSEDAFKPIRETVEVDFSREWTHKAWSITESVSDKASTAARGSAGFMKAFKLAREWKDELEATLMDLRLVERGSYEAYEDIFGHSFLPKYKVLDDPYALEHTLNTPLLKRSRKDFQPRKELYSDTAKNKTITEANKKTDFVVKPEYDEVGNVAVKHAGEPVYEADAIVILANHAIDVMLAKNSTEFLDAAIKKFGKPVNFRTNSLGKVAPHADEGWKHLDHPAFKDIQLPDEVMEMFTKWQKTFLGGDPTSNKFWRHYDKILGIWKGYATFVNPGFHGRNFMSNHGLLYLKDGPAAFSLKSHSQAVRILRGDKGKVVLPGGRVLQNSEVMKIAEEYGVVGTGWFGADIKSARDVRTLLFGGPKPDSSKAGKMLRKFNPADPDNVAFQAGKYAGGWVENEARMVGFLNDLKRTGNELYAANNTKKFLFNYNELTNFERGTMKRIFPFYAWMRKNAVLQMEQIIKQPAKFADVARVRNAFERASPDVDERWVPEYFPELYAFRTPLKTSRGSQLYVNPNMPFQDINRMFDPGDWVSSVAPWKTVFELAANKNFFNKHDIQNYKGEKSEAEWLNILPDSLLNVLKPLMGAEKVVEPETGRMYWGIPPKVKFAVEQAWPVLRNVGKLIPKSEESIPYYRQEKAPYNLMAYYTGVKLMPYNVAEEMEKQVFQRRDRLRDIKKSAERSGKVPSKRIPRTH